jgi:hypothetical protein
VAFIAFLVALQIVAMISPVTAGPAGVEVGALALVVYLVVTGAAALTEMRTKKAA